MHADVLLTGLSGCGKTTLGKLIAQKFGLRLYETRTIARTLAEEHGFQRIRYWYDAVGAREINQAISNRLMDMLVVEKNHIVVDDILCCEMLFPFSAFSRKVITICLNIDDDERLRRVSVREHKSLDQAAKELALLDRFKLEGGIKSVMLSAQFQLTNSDTESTLKQISSIIYENI